MIRCKECKFGETCPEIKNAYNCEDFEEKVTLNNIVKKAYKNQYDHYSKDVEAQIVGEIEEYINSIVAEKDKEIKRLREALPIIIKALTGKE